MENIKQLNCQPTSETRMVFHSFDVVISIVGGGMCLLYDIYINWIVQEAGAAAGWGSSHSIFSPLDRLLVISTARPPVVPLKFKSPIDWARVSLPGPAPRPATCRSSGFQDAAPHARSPVPTIAAQLPTVNH